MRQPTPTKVNWINRQNGEDHFAEQSEKSGILKCGAQGAGFKDCVQVYPDVEVIDRQIAALQFARECVVNECFDDPSDLKQRTKQRKVDQEAALAQVTVLEQERDRQLAQMARSGSGQDLIQATAQDYDRRIDIAKLKAQA